ncbi:uncharacterized protein LOC130361029 [Hyla sarda]|uniref:uncharacterized protein LOC130361029 n=1 Tax=Hyla sarda TaxID=327740 RepID=UPI0024C2D969|nr:uncharacterized protein LOC130361029 [Hyla sarda]
MPKDPTVASIYLLPKVHKNAKCPPGRPILSGCNNLSEPLCKYIDFFLSPLVENLPSYLKDTNDVLRKINHTQLDENMLLVTCDVESLYTSIRHLDGIEAGTSIELEEFIARLNCNSINIKLTYSIGKPSIDFLDIKIDVDEQGFITTDLFRKQTAANMVLHATSAHPRHLINNIPVGQYIRARRICSNDFNFEKQAKDLQGKKKNIVHPDNENMIRLIVDHHSRTSEVRGIDRVYFDTRGGDWKRALAKKETMWMEKLRARSPYGLNEYNSFAPFL